MKTCGDIEKRLETLKHKVEQARIDENYWAVSDHLIEVETLEWVLDLEEEKEIVETATIEWDGVPPRSMEEIMFDLYLKEKSNEDQR